MAAGTTTSPKTKPDAIINRHKRYKLGTAKVLRWLARAANGCVNLATSLNCLKGEAKSSKQKPSIRLTTRELQLLAKIIADSDPPVTVPAEITRILQDVIGLRKECAAWYAAQAIDQDSDLAAKNKSHSYFISVLEQVLAAIEGSETADSTNIKQAGPLPTKDNKDGKSNISSEEQEKATSFELHEIEDCLERESPTPAAAMDIDESTEVVLEEDKDTEATFALWALLMDMGDVRLAIRDAWHDYRQGALSLEVVGMLTQTGISMIRRADEEFITAYPHLRSWLEVFSCFRLHMRINSNLAYVYSRDEHATAKQTDVRGELVDFFCPAAGLLLIAFREAALVCGDSMLQNGRTWSRARVECGKVKTLRVRTKFEATLFSMIPELCYLKAFSTAYANSQSSDHFQRSQHHQTDFTDALLDLIWIGSGSGYKDTRDAPLWAVFACAVHMDVYEAIDGRMSIGADALLQVAEETVITVDRTLDWHRPVTSPDIFVEREKTFTDVGKQAEYVSNVICQSREFDSVCLSRGFNSGLEKIREKAKTLFSAKRCVPGLDALPSVAGTIAYHIKTELHDRAALTANYREAVLLLAHLYKACREYQLLEDNWTDMDMLLAWHPEFTSGKKKRKGAAADRYAILKRYVTDLGLDTTTVAIGKAPDALGTIGITRTATTKFLSPYASKFRIAYHQFQDEQPSLDRKHDEIVDMVLTALKAESDPSKTKSSQLRPTQYTPVELLSTLKKCMVKDERELNFDYAGFVISCQKALSSILTTICPREAENTHNAVYYLLKLAADAEIRGTRMNRTALAKAANHLSGILDKEGRAKFSKEASTKSSGGIPKAMLPVFQKQDSGVNDALQKMLNGLNRKEKGASAGISRQTIEIYDAAGSHERFVEALANEGANVYIPEGIALTSCCVVPSKEDIEDEKKHHGDVVELEDSLLPEEYGAEVLPAPWLTFEETVTLMAEMAKAYKNGDSVA